MDRSDLMRVAAVMAALLALPFFVRFGAPRRAIPPKRTTDLPLKVVNEAIGTTADEVDRAIVDLKEIGMWDDLTKDLYVVHVHSRPRSDDTPLDGHVADAQLLAWMDEDGIGSSCDIMFFPPAMDQPKSFFEDAVERGRMPRMPTERQFWAQVLGHELAHCMGDNGQPEDVAQLWEWRVLQRLAEEGIE